MRRSIAAALGAAALAVALAGCSSASAGTSHPAASASPSASTPSAAAPPGPSAATLERQAVAAPLAQAVKDLRASDAAEQEAWVTGGYGSDLQALIDVTQGMTGSSPLDTAARTFATDASAYLADNSDGNGTGILAQGWQSGYHQIRIDINQLATLCRQPGAPQPVGSQA